MSASKDHWGVRGGRTGWQDASSSRRCPVCRSDSWCQIGAGEHAGVVLCKRAPSPRAKQNRDGVTFYVHTQSERSANDALPDVAMSSVRGFECAPADVLDDAYRAVLGALWLDQRHHENLRARGLSDEAIALGLYRSLPLGGRARLAAMVERAVDERWWPRVPGMMRASREGRSWWSFGGAVGMLIPTRDLEGRIVALKVRSDDRALCRYTSVSSKRCGGPSPDVSVHVPHVVSQSRRARRFEELWITEGELKADVAAALSGRAVVGIPGVSFWKRAVEFADAVRPRRVVIALDADWKDPRKRFVRLARERLLIELETRGFETFAADWPIEAGKGIDDYLLLQKRAARTRGNADSTSTRGAA